MPNPYAFNEDTSLELRRIFAHVVPVHSRKIFTNLHFLSHNLQYDVVRRTAERMLVEIRTYVLEDRRPATWWQKLKHRWFPGFLLRLFPVAWSHYVCPHIPKKMEDRELGYDYKQCLGFLEGPKKRG